MSKKIPIRFEFSAGGVVYKKEGNDVKLALIMDSYGKWTFPKGHIEKNEKPELAALREVEEEIGIEAKPIKLLEKIDYWFKEKNILVHKYVYFFLMESQSTKFRIQKGEIKDVQWFSPKKAKEMLGYKDDSEKLLSKAIENLR